MKLTKTQRLILHSLAQFYQSLNQPLNEKPVKVRTSKITFIELLEQSDIFVKQKRALYKNLETLEKKKLLTYENHMIILSEEGLAELKKLTFELYQFSAIEKYFHEVEKPKRKLQTVIES